MIRPSHWLRSGLAVASLLAMSYPSLAAAQQPSGYQQQPPPSYYPQQPGYAQQPPPPGYQQTPPGYPQQPGYYPAQPGVEPAPSDAKFRRGFLAMPYLGVQIPTGDYGDFYDAGLRLGTFLGGHLGPMLSLNGEFTIDVLNPKDTGGADVTAVMVDMVFSPLFHFGANAFEAFVGPKFGFFGYAMTVKQGGLESKSNAQGIAYGLNLGIGIPVGTVAVGGLFSWVGRHANRACQKRPGYSEKCYDDPSGDDLQSVSFSAMVLF